MPYLYPYMEELHDDVFEGEFLAIVVDTGGFAASNPTQLDIATSW